MGKSKRDSIDPAAIEEPTATISFQDGNTTVIVGLHFKQKGKTTLDERVRKLIQSDVKAGNF